jgi:hypothetical protein
MVIVNRIVNILILLAAIAAAVFSYMLFSKREKLLDGWKQMATAIQTTAKTIDDGGASGTTAAKDLPADKMLHENYEQLNQVLPKLNKNAKDLVLQRNDLAASMSDLAGVLKASGVTDAGLRNIGSYKDQQRILLNQARSFRSISDSVSSEYSNTGRIFGASTSAGQLRNSATYRTAVKQINDKARDAVARRNNYQRYLVSFSKAARVSSPSFVGSSYTGSLEKVRNQIAGKLAELDRVNAQLKREQGITRSLRSQLAARDNTIRARNAVIKKRETHIKFLENVLSMDGTRTLPPKLLTPADRECYSFVRGKIQYVDRDYGFITVNIGKNYMFAQQYGVKKNIVHFPLKQGSVLTVIRRVDGKNPQVIGKVKVTKVEADSSVCNLLDGKPELYRAGDEVIFSEEDIPGVSSGRKK